MNRQYPIVAVVIIIIAAVGFLALQPGGTSSQSQQSTPGGVTSSSAVGSSTTSAGSQQGGGRFAMLVTDPEMSASGASKIYLHYTGEEVHSAGSASASGWTNMNVAGNIELTGSVNTTQTVAAATTFAAGTYDMARLDVSSVTVLYNNQNYTAATATSQLNAKMQTQARVNSSASTEAIVDLHTIVLNTGNTSKPQFVFSASAKATVVPSSDVSNATMTVGARTSLTGKAWWSSFSSQTSANLQITSATLTSGSLKVNVKNAGNDNTTAHAVTVTPLSIIGGASVTIPASLSSSAVITVNSNNSTAQASGQASAQAVFGGSGTNIAAGSSTTLTFNGTIQLKVGGLLSVSGVVTGQQYLVTCIAGDTVVSTTVTAG